MMQTTQGNGIWMMGALAIGLSACGDGSGGRVQVILQAEETISAGLDPGDGEEDLVDGWTVRFDKWILTFGNFSAARSSDPADRIGTSEVRLVDLRSLPTAGLTILDVEGVAPERFDRVSYETPTPNTDTIRDESVTEEDYNRMVQDELVFLITGTATATDGETELSFDFEWGVRAPTRYTDCGPEEGDLGFAVVDGGSTAVEATIHGDHVFFNAFPGATENISRRAAWLLLADLDQDRFISMDELETSRATDLFPQGLYSLTGSPLQTDTGDSGIETGLDWVTAQQHTVGHLQGEGACAWSVLNP